MMERVVVERENEDIARLKMVDVEHRNIFTEEFIRSLLSGLDSLEAYPRPKVVILQGLADVFCGGADKKTLLELSEGKLSMGDLVLSERVVGAPFPMIAAMEGHAMGGGLVLALCCDIIIAARESRYGAVFMNMGFTPGMGCTTMLRELVGPYIANEMMYTGRRFRGSDLEKKSTGINYVLPKKEVLGKAWDIALQIAEKGRESLHLLKHSLSGRNKKLMIEARLQEDLMHASSFRHPETRKMIEDFYA